MSHEEELREYIRMRAEFWSHPITDEELEKLTQLIIRLAPALPLGITAFVEFLFRPLGLLESLRRIGITERD